MGCMQVYSLWQRVITETAAVQEEAEAAATAAQMPVAKNSRHSTAA